MFTDYEKKLNDIIGINNSLLRLKCSTINRNNSNVDNISERKILRKILSEQVESALMCKSSQHQL